MGNRDDGERSFLYLQIVGSYVASCSMSGTKDALERTLSVLVTLF